MSIYRLGVLGRNAKVDLLCKVPLFSGCTKGELRELALVSDEVQLGEGTVLTKEGSTGREFFVLVDGTVRVSRKSRKLAELGAGDWFGEIALLTHVPRTATVTAITPIRVLVIDDRRFQGAVKTMPSIAIKVLATVGKRLSRDAQS